MVELGCTYLQFDDTSLAYLNDPNQRKMMSERGEDAEHLHVAYIRHINEALADKPEGITITTHMCRGNFRSSWVAEGYDFVAEALFGELGVDGFFLEYDDALGRLRAAALRAEGQLVVLGLVTTKRGELEDKDELKRRIEEASQFIDLDQLCLSPSAASRRRRGQQRHLRRAGGQAAPHRRGRGRGLGLSDRFDVSGLRAVVTGAASGLGLRWRRRWPRGRARDARRPRRRRSRTGRLAAVGSRTFALDVPIPMPSLLFDDVVLGRAASTSPSPTPGSPSRGAGRARRSRGTRRRHLAHVLGVNLDGVLFTMREAAAT